MLVDGTLVVVAAAALAAVIFTRRRSHDDVHSVEGYHRQIHTLESMGGHPTRPGDDTAPAEAARPAYPESAVRLAGTSTVKITDGASPPVPPVPPPPAAEPVSFDDEPSPSATEETTASKVPSTRAARRQDRAMNAMNRRPRRLAAPAAAVGGVVVLIAVLLVVGEHTVGPGSHRNKGTGHHTTTTVTVQPAVRHHRHRPTTSTTTTVPIVSLPTSGSAGDVTYDVAGSTFVLSLSATTGQCWVQVSDTASGAVLYTGTLGAGGQHTVNATGPLTVVVGAPSVLAASVNGRPVTMPQGYQTPLTMRFVTAAPTTTSTSTTS